MCQCTDFLTADFRSSDFLLSPNTCKKSSDEANAAEGESLQGRPA